MSAKRKIKEEYCRNLLDDSDVINRVDNFVNKATDNVTVIRNIANIERVILLEPIISNLPTGCLMEEVNKTTITSS